MATAQEVYGVLTELLREKDLEWVIRLSREIRDSEGSRRVSSTDVQRLSDLLDTMEMALVEPAGMAERVFNSIQAESAETITLEFREDRQEIPEAETGPHERIGGEREEWTIEGSAAEMGKPKTILGK